MEGKGIRIDIGAYGQVCLCYNIITGADPDCPRCDGREYLIIQIVRPKREYL